MVKQLIDKIELTEEQKQVLYGALLGDGSLILHKNGKNAIFSYTSKSKQHVEYVSNSFKKYWSGEGIKLCTYYDSRTNKEYCRYVMRTYTNEFFTDEYKKWYKNGTKTIPKDLRLTPLMCKIWYIGDGGICHSHKSEWIKLSTQCFSKEEQEEILLPQLSQFEATLMKADISKDKQRQYYIYIPHRKEKEFLDYIGECPFDDYLYKWRISEYKNKMPKNHQSKEREFCEMYLSGMTYYAIAKNFGIEPNAVKYYLIKNGLYKLNKKVEGQYGQDISW